MSVAVVTPAQVLLLLPQLLCMSKCHAQTYSSAVLLFDSLLQCSLPSSVSSIMRLLMIHCYNCCYWLLLLLLLIQGVHIK
jgi:hypothetical protein